jgi:hypothetical protein
MADLKFLRSSKLIFGQEEYYAAVPNAVNYQGRCKEYGQPVTPPQKATTARGCGGYEC